MKIIENNKISNLDRPFAIFGTKEQLIECEKSLQKNGIKDDDHWNSLTRYDNDYKYIVVYRNDKYCYHMQNYGKPIVNIDYFI